MVVTLEILTKNSGIMFSFFIDDKKLTVSFEERISKKNPDSSKTYCKVVFNKSSTNFIPLWATTKDEKSMKDFAEWTAMVIDYEYRLNPEHYSLRGMSDRLSRLGTFLTEMLDFKVPELILDPLGDVLTYNQYKFIEESPMFKYDSDFHVFAHRFFHIERDYHLVLEDELPRKNFDFYKSAFIFRLFEYQKVLKNGLFMRNKLGFHFTRAEWFYNQNLKDEFIEFIQKLSNWDYEEEKYEEKLIFKSDFDKEIFKDLELSMHLRRPGKSMIFKIINRFFSTYDFDEYILEE